MKFIPPKTNKVLVSMGGQAVGSIALTPDGLCAFQYDAQWLLHGFSISPYELPLDNRVFIANHHPFDGGFGVFDDCLPDGWGSLILDRLLKKEGINPNSLSLLDRLSLVGSSGRGALCFEPDYSEMNLSAYDSIETIAREASNILSSDSYDGDGIENLYKRGGSPGGARPKASVLIDGVEWLVKFQAKGDSDDIGKKEYDYSLLAKKCDIEMPETRLLENRYFAVKRFDRTLEGEHIHCVSMAGLLQADYRIPSIDYKHIFQVCHDLTRNQADLWKVFSLMCFNYAIDNKDDHAKNFAFLHDDMGWHFAPAFDLLPSDGMNGYRTTSINDSIVPQDNDLIALAIQFGLDKKKAEKRLQSILHEVKQ